METRELRYFVAVAEERHFGRAAQRLGIAQPPLSRAIQQLERRLGVTLLDRANRTVALTEAGAVLLCEGRAALAAVEAATRRTRRAGSGLVLAMKAGASTELLRRLLDTYGEPVEVVLCGIAEQARMLRDGRADAALLHLPFDATTGFDTQALHTEGQVVVLPPGHALADRPHLLTAETAALPLARWPGPDGEFVDGPGPQVRDSAQLYELIALGRAAAIVPESSGTHLHRDLPAVPLIDAPTVTTVIAWPPHSRSRALAAFVHAAGLIGQAA
ncbi:LysR family transcriptional regulator [Kutzneria sp. 744]|uniref:LysR family transcriptional regulator n=1 Tax=Kutzneria sp. (strain 744) TaxID=345341 RepID=UPI0003EED39D|nr:LysR family transcriptional regulator [Kutzneria sp. 744]EWM10792.1 LysR-family transcriptional regulator [Kutzneria sp. 744]